MIFQTEKNTSTPPSIFRNNNWTIENPYFECQNTFLFNLLTWYTFNLVKITIRKMFLKNENTYFKFWLYLNLKQACMNKNIFYSDNSVLEIFIRLVIFLKYILKFAFTKNLFRINEEWKMHANIVNAKLFDYIQIFPRHTIIRIS